MANTTFMNLTLPIPTVTLGPDYATLLNTALESIDSHDHSSGKGSKIPIAALNINADLDFQQNKIYNLNSLQLTERTTLQTGVLNKASIQVFSNDLYYINNSGVSVQLTSGGALATSPGSAQTFEITTINTDIILAPSDTFVYLIVDTTVARSITLPAASAVSGGRIYIIKDLNSNASTNNITITPNGADTIDSNANLVIDSSSSTTMLVGDGVSNWLIS